MTWTYRRAEAGEAVHGTMMILGPGGVELHVIANEGDDVALGEFIVSRLNGPGSGFVGGTNPMAKQQGEDPPPVYIVKDAKNAEDLYRQLRSAVVSHDRDCARYGGANVVIPDMPCTCGADHEPRDYGAEPEDGQIQTERKSGMPE